MFQPGSRWTFLGHGSFAFQAGRLCASVYERLVQTFHLCAEGGQFLLRLSVALVGFQGLLLRGGQFPLAGCYPFLVPGQFQFELIGSRAGLGNRLGLRFLLTVQRFQSGQQFFAADF